MRRRRARFARDHPDAAEQAAAHFPARLVATAQVVGGYYPVGAELDPWPLLIRFAAAGAALTLPATTAIEAPLVFRLWSAGDSLAPDVLGIPSPTALRGVATPDLILAPMLAFDRTGGRLGQGGGSFDRTLAALRAHGPVMVVGVAFSGQEVETVPRETHDQPIDAILTERTFFEIGR